MAQCPKCHKKLKATDWRQTCPYCGANIILYDLQERLMQEADVAEVQYYHFQKKIDRMKTAFIGSKLSVFRIFTSLMPLIAVFLPQMKLKLSEPLKPFEGNFGGIELYNTIGDIDTGVLIKLFSDSASGTSAILLAVSALSLILSLVVMLIHLICLTMACGRKGKARNYILDSVFLALALISAGTVIFMPESPAVSASPAYGSFIYIALIILNFVTDALVFREKIPIIHAPCYVGGIPIEEYFEMIDKGVPKEEIRAEMYRRLTAIQQEKERELEEKAEEAENV